MIVSAVVFLLLLFFLKSESQYKNEATGDTKQDVGLTYGNERVSDLVNKDTDSDGVPDWEESLWGTDPTKKVSNQDGIPDEAYIEKLKTETGKNGTNLATGPVNEGNLTQTDKFSRELFSTITALNQAGPIDQNTIDKLSGSLADQIKNSPQRKIFTLAEIKITNDSSKQATQNYSEAMNNLYKKYPMNGNVIDILNKLNTPDNNIDNASTLSELDPFIKQTKGIIDGMVKMAVPKELASLHLDVINGLEKLTENLSDIQLLDSDTVVALGAISQYQKNTETLQMAVDKLYNTVKKKLNQ